MKPTSLLTLDDGRVRNLAFLGAIVGGTLLGPVTGVAALGVVGAGVVGLLANLWTGEMADRRAERLASSKYAHPNNDLTHLLADGVIRVLNDCAMDSPDHKAWLIAIANAAEKHYFELAGHPSLRAIRSDKILFLFELAARTDEHHALDLLDETVANAKSIAWSLIEFLRDASMQLQNGSAQKIAEAAVIKGLFAAVREMLKRNPKGRAYAAIQLDTNGEILARLATLADNSAEQLHAQGIASADFAAVRKLLTDHANKTFYSASLVEDERMALRVILDETLASGERLHRVENKLDKAHEKLDGLAQGQQMILEALQDLKKKGIDPKQAEYSQELLAAAQLLLERGSLEQRALAEIVKGRHIEANAILEELLADPLAEAFKLLTYQGDNWYAAGEFDAAISPYEKALALRPEDFTARNNTAIAHTFARRDDIAAHQHRAIELYEGTLQRVASGSSDWAMTQLNLGNALAYLPNVAKQKNLNMAISCYDNAMTVYTPSAHPYFWGLAQNNRGNAWADFPTGDISTNLRNAITAYHAALTVRTKSAYPFEWAMTQNNLAIAWRNMPTGDRTLNMLKAIDAYTAASTVFTKSTRPVEWATMQSNLGAAWRAIPSGDLRQNLILASEAYVRALSVLTKVDHPLLWAAAQCNVGVLWLNVKEGERSENLKKSIAAFEKSLSVYTKTAHPVEWAGCMYDLSVALYHFADLPGDEWRDPFRRAISTAKAAALIYTPDEFPHDHAKTTTLLQMLRTGHEFSGCSAEFLFDDVPPAQ